MDEQTSSTYSQQKKHLEIIQSSIKAIDLDINNNICSERNKQGR